VQAGAAAQAQPEARSVRSAEPPCPATKAQDAPADGSEPEPATPSTEETLNVLVRDMINGEEVVCRVSHGSGHYVHALEVPCQAIRIDLLRAHVTLILCLPNPRAGGFKSGSPMLQHANGHDLSSYPHLCSGACCRATEQDAEQSSRRDLRRLPHFLSCLGLDLLERQRLFVRKHFVAGFSLTSPSPLPYPACSCCGGR
jgi:hypothetical protein